MDEIKNKDIHAFVCSDQSSGKTHCELCKKPLGDEPLMIYKSHGKVICHNCMSWLYDIWCETGLKATEQEKDRILGIVEEFDFNNNREIIKDSATIRSELKTKINGG